MTCRHEMNVYVLPLFMFFFTLPNSNKIAVCDVNLHSSWLVKWFRVVARDHIANKMRCFVPFTTVER